MAQAQISKLRIYPIKSLRHVEVSSATVGVRSLQNDRRFAIVDADGRYINGKRTGQVNLLQADYDLPNGLVHLAHKEAPEDISTFELREGNTELDEYLSAFFDIRTQLVENTSGAFMDMPGTSSVTIVSEATYRSLQKDLWQHSLENLRRRFRTNIELSGIPAYGEEQLYQAPDTGMRFRIGEVEMLGISPRARCNVPPQDPNTGDMDYYFMKQMIQSRQATMPTDSTLLQYGRRPYFLTVNTYLPESELGKQLHIGDTVEIIGPVDLG